MYLVHPILVKYFFRPSLVFVFLIIIDLRNSWAINLQKWLTAPRKYLFLINFLEKGDDKHQILTHVEFQMQINNQHNYFIWANFKH